MELTASLKSGHSVGRQQEVKESTWRLLRGRSAEVIGSMKVREVKKREDRNPAVILTAASSRHFLPSPTLSATGSQGQQSQQRYPDFLLCRHFFQLLGGYSEVFPGQPRDSLSACPGSASGPPPGGTYLEILLREACHYPKFMAMGESRSID